MACVCGIIEKKSKAELMEVYLSGEGEKPGKQLTMLDLNRFRGLEGSAGLCAARFKPNVITNGFDFCSASPGEKFKIGEAVIELTQIGKKCLDECPVHQSGNRCALSYSAVFANVLQPGTVRLGDTIAQMM